MVYTQIFAQCMTTASELIPSLIAQVLSRGLKEKLNPVYFSRLLLLAMNFSSWRNMESASEFSTSVYTVARWRGGKTKRSFFQTTVDSSF